MKRLNNLTLDQEAMALVCRGLLVDGSDRVAGQCVEIMH